MKRFNPLFVKEPMSAVPRTDAAPTALPRPLSANARLTLLDISRSASPDPFPDEVAAPQGWEWHYAPSGYEIGALQRVVAEGHETNRSVDYAGNFAAAIDVLSIRGQVSIAGTLECRASGTLSLSINGEARQAGDGPGNVAMVLSLETGDEVEILVTATPGTASLGTADSSTAVIDWRVSLGGEWVLSKTRPGDERPPHTHGEAEFALTLAPVGRGMFALPAPALGRLRIDASEVTSMTTGESLEEALSDPVFAESRNDVDHPPDAPSTHVSRHRLGFQFARIDGIDVREVAVDAAIRPASRRGAFASSDPRLNQIWATAAYTLRLCMQTFIVDGIKRDRMPWLGDHALGVLTNAHAFADQDVIRDTLTALGRPRHGYINGIADYSLWWVISHALYQEHFDDTEYLLGQAEHIDAFLDDLATHSDDTGVFRPVNLPDSFEQAGPGSLFLDWGVQLRGDHDSTAVQILWHWALTSGATVLRKAGHPGAARWRTLAGRVQALLQERGWNYERGHWRDYLGLDSGSSAYPNFLATLAGIDAPLDSTVDTRAQTIAANGAGTPFMRAFALLSLGRLGQPTEAVETIRELWGRMLDAGARTFWEEFDSADASPYEMYRRPFGKSLCHAWSAGPAALLPRLTLGVEPLADGWREFTVSPTLGSLDWAGCVIPTPHGDLTVLADHDEIVVEIPEGTSLVTGSQRFSGPQSVHLPSS